MMGQTFSTLFLAMTLCLGCDFTSPRDNSSDAPTSIEYRFEGKVVLGSPSLTAGIPGAGPLTSEQIRRWFDDPKVHRELDFALPLGLRDATDQVWIPSENQLTRAKIELGRQLFFDTRLSEYDDFACATCHIPEQDYAAYMVMPEIGRNPSVCFNRILSEQQFWDGRVESLEVQPVDPISNTFEMNTTPESCVARLKSIEGYQQQFDAIFGRLDMETIGFALACFQRALVTGPAPWDYRRLSKENEQLRADAEAHPMSESAIRGEELFFGDRTRCSWCHSGPNFTDEQYYNIGIGMDQEDPDLGRFDVTEDRADIGAFKTPTLRNVANTPPYMHDGQFDTLRKVVDWFDRGGFVHKHLDATIQPLNLTNQEKRDLVAFLKSLSGALPPVEKLRLPQ